MNKNLQLKIKGTICIAIIFHLHYFERIFLINSSLSSSKSFNARLALRTQKQIIQIVKKNVKTVFEK